MARWPLQSWKTRHPSCENLNETHPHPTGYIITGISDDVPESDPYRTRAEAESDRRGMERFIEADRRGDTEFIHGQKPKGECHESAS
jgi:hypothetical protein